MPAYVVALIRSIHDPETYERYVAQVAPTLTPHGGRFLARKPEPETLEGGPAPSRAIILRFPSIEDARAWHASAAYQPVLALRQAASDGMLLLLPSVDPQVALQEVCFIEMVTTDVEATRRMCETIHGWTFTGPTPELGQAYVAELASGACCSIRAPMHAEEVPVTRVYVRVADIDDAAKRAAEHAQLILAPMEIEGRGRIAIVLSGGVQHGLWEVP